MNHQFTTIVSDDRFHVLRNGEPVGSVQGYATATEARAAIAQVQRWDRIVDPDVESRRHSGVGGLRLPG